MHFLLLSHALLFVKSHMQIPHMTMLSAGLWVLQWAEISLLFLWHHGHFRGKHEKEMSDSLETTLLVHFLFAYEQSAENKFAQHALHFGSLNFGIQMIRIQFSAGILQWLGVFPRSERQDPLSDVSGKNVESVIKNLGSWVSLSHRWKSQNTDDLTPNLTFPVSKMGGHCFCNKTQEISCKVLQKTKARQNRNF